MSSDFFVPAVGTLATTDQILFDEILCIADSKFILGNWYFIALMNGRSVADWTALSAMLQNHYGHARALYRYLTRFGFTREEAEWLRPAHSIRSARVLDKAPISWADFVVTSDLAERAFSNQLSSLASNASVDPQLSRLAYKIIKETNFHQLYFDGWTRLLVDGRAEETQRALGQRLPTLLEWWGVDDESADPFYSAGLRSDSNLAISRQFLDQVVHSYSPLDISITHPISDHSVAWSAEVRRSGPRGIPAALHELIRFKEPELAIP